MIYQLIGESPNLQSPEIAGEIKAYLNNGTLINEESEEFRCGVSKGGDVGMKKRGPIVEREKKTEWQKTGNVCGILYYYKEQDIMNLYIYSDEEQTEIVKLR